jgi:hypothetical protein
MAILAASYGHGAPASAAHPIAAPTTYRVRPGSTVLACGGFDGHCEIRHLRGTIEIFSGYNGHFTGDGLPPAIVHSALELVTTGGHASPFPAAGDLPLTSLEGFPDAGRLRFESPAGSQQTAELVFIPFRDGAGASGGYALDGFYDEGCCDRFRVDFGNVVLRQDRGLASLDLHDGRFHVVVEWQASPGLHGTGHPVALDDDSGHFWFFSPDNPEVFVKVLDACAVNGRYWLFAGGLTNLGVEIAFFDDRTDFAIPASSPLGAPFATFIDGVGFPCDAPPGNG